MDSERLRLWNQLPGRVRMPDGESLYDVRRRALTATRSLIARHAGQTICFVSHDVVVKVLVAEVLGMDYDHLGRLGIANCGVSIVEGGRQSARVVTLNDTAHLREVNEGA